MESEMVDESERVTVWPLQDFSLGATPGGNVAMKMFYRDEAGALRSIAFQLDDATLLRFAQGLLEANRMAESKRRKPN